MFIFFTGDPYYNTSCPNGWTCKPVNRSIAFKYDSTSGKYLSPSGNLSFIINLGGLILGEFSRHNFSERNLYRDISFEVNFLCILLSYYFSTSLSHVIVLQDSLAITVNINEVIWKILETFRFKARNSYEFNFSANKHIFCSYFFRILLSYYFPTSLSPKSQRKICLIQQQVEANACCTKKHSVSTSWLIVEFPTPLCLWLSGIHWNRAMFEWITGQKIYWTRPSIGRWFELKMEHTFKKDT